MRHLPRQFHLWVGIRESRCGGTACTQYLGIDYAPTSKVAQALATADTRSGELDPGTVAQPPFSTKSPCAHESVFLSAARLATTSGVP